MEETISSQYFEILELKPDSTAQEIKQAYKDLIKVWHPDRFSHDPKLQVKAQEKLKLINEAYEKLKNYQPAVSAENKPQSANNEQSKEGINISSNSTEENSDFNFAQEVDKPANKLIPIIVIIVAIFGLVIFFVYFSNFQKNKTAEINNINTNSANDKSVLQSKQPIKPKPENSFEETKNLTQPNNESTIVNRSLKVNADNNFFTLGSTKDEVLAVQGTPDTITNNSFGYSYSTIYFQDSLVKGWSNIGHNLKVKMFSSSATTENNYTIGSTKEDVIKVQGTPDNVSGGSFGYGYSTVYFKDNKVIRWSNIDRKLKVIMKPQSN